MRNWMLKFAPLAAVLFPVLLLLGSPAVTAATPKDIKFASKGTTMFGGTYLVYSVRCSDGTVRKISSWDKRKKWCIGTQKSNCSNDQLQTAKKACQ